MIDGIGKSIVACIVVMFVAGCLVTSCTSWLFGGDDLSDSLKEKIEACEKSLPRDEHCVILVVPSKETGEK